MLGKSKKLSKSKFNLLVSQSVSKDRLILHCQDHCFRIYSECLNMVMETPCFKTEEVAENYTYDREVDRWNGSDDVNW